MPPEEYRIISKRLTGDGIGLATCKTYVTSFRASKNVPYTVISGTIVNDK
jgi:hypothetical protein